MLARLYRPFYRVAVLAGTIAVATWIYFNVALNKAAAQAFFVHTSSVVLLILFFIVAARYAVLAWFAYLQHVENTTTSIMPGELPLVSVIVPAYNEGKLIVSSVDSLLKQDYPRMEIVIVDDGSSDDTYACAVNLAAQYGDQRIRVVRQENSGKANALNHGIRVAKGSLILCMDGDSLLEPQTVRMAVRHFVDPAVGAVAGNVKVMNRTNWLTRLQTLEYIEGISLVRTAHAFFRRVTIIPGPIGVFRKDVLEKLSGYRDDTYAEDCELTLRILMGGWKIHYEEKAIAWTEAPETLQALFNQRYRWSRGILQAILRHKSELGKPWRQPLDCLFLWMLVFEGLAWPALNILGNLLFILVAAWVGFPMLIVLWWAQLTILDFVAALFCVALEKEDIRIACYSILYRMFFIPFLDVIKLFSSIDEFYGVGMKWRKLERLGAINGASQNMEATWN
jgi:poly-beta-1,6 N-acetyl-D-glucosamine synthase